MTKLPFAALLVSGGVLVGACMHETAAPPSGTAVIVTPPSPEASENSWGVANKMPASTATAPLETNDQADADLRITAALRKAIALDDTLSFAARNIDIVTSNGSVVLRGPVKSGHDRGSIEKKARTTPGVTGVDNLLEVQE